MTNDYTILVLENESQTAALEKEAVPKKVTIADFINDDGEGDEDFCPEAEAEEEEDDAVELSDEDDDGEEFEQEEVVEVEVKMPAKVAPSKKKAAPIKDKSVDELALSVKKLAVRDFDMAFKLPYMVLEHMDHGQMLASVEMLVVGVHRRHVHLKIVGSNQDVLQVKIAVPSLFYTPNRSLVANDDGTGTFNVNTHKATEFRRLCQSIMKTENDDTGEVFGEPQLIQLPFPCDEIFYKGHGGERDGWDIQVYDNDDVMLKREIGNTDLFMLNIDCVAKEKPVQPKAAGRMRRVTAARVPKRAAKDENAMSDGSS